MTSALSGLRRAFLALAALCLAFPAFAAVLPATPGASVAAAIKAAQPGDTIALTGVFTKPDFYAMSRRSWAAPGITFDLAAATFRDVGMNDVAGVTFKAGRYEATVPKSQGLRIDRATRLRIEGGTFTAAPGITDAYGLRIVGDATYGGNADVTLTGLRFEGLRNGAHLAFVARGAVADSYFTRITANGLMIAAGSAIAIERNQFFDFRPGPGEHVDAIQFANETATSPGTQGAIVRGNVIVGQAQGVFGRVDDAVIADNQIRCSFAYGIGVVGRAPVIEGNDLRTLAGPGALQCRIVVERMPGAVLRGINSVGGWNGNPAKVMAPTP